MRDLALHPRAYFNLPNRGGNQARLGTGGTVNSSRPGFHALHKYSEPGSGSAHGFADNTSFSVTAEGYNSFDSFCNITGTSLDHHNGFQFRPNVNVSGTVSAVEGYVSTPVIAGGSVTDLEHHVAVDATGAGTVGTQYGFFCFAMTKGSANWAFYAAGATKSRFEGLTAFGAVTPIEQVHVYSADAYALIEVSGTNAGGIKLKKNGTQRFSINMPAASADLDFLDASGNHVLYLAQGGGVGIGTTAPATVGNLTVANNLVIGNNANATQTLTANLSGTDVVVTFGSAAVQFGAITLNVTGTRFVQSYHTNITSTNAVTVDSSGTVKENIAPYAGDALGTIAGMQVVTYRHIPTLDLSGATKLGILSESCNEPLALDWIARDGGEAYKGFNSYGLDTLAVRAIQQLLDRIKVLESKTLHLPAH